MALAIGSIVFLLVGLPLLAWWVGGRHFWGRLQPGAEADSWGDYVRRHRLTAAEQIRIKSAVSRGQALDDERLRLAAVDLAEQTRDQLRLTWRSGSRLHRVVVLLAVVWFVLLVARVVAALVSAVASGGPGVPWLGIVSIAAIVGVPLVQRRNLRRTIERNSGPPSPPAA